MLKNVSKMIHTVLLEVTRQRCDLRVCVGKGGVEPPTFRFSVGRSYQLSYLARSPAVPASRGAMLQQRPSWPAHPTSQPG